MNLKEKSIVELSSNLSQVENTSLARNNSWSRLNNQTESKCPITDHNNNDSDGNLLKQKNLE
jgi:hypothetical protein